MTRHSMAHTHSLQCSTNAYISLKLKTNSLTSVIGDTRATILRDCHHRTYVLYLQNIHTHDEHLNWTFKATYSVKDLTRESLSGIWNDETNWIDETIHLWISHGTTSPTKSLLGLSKTEIEVITRALLFYYRLAATAGIINVNTTHPFAKETDNITTHFPTPFEYKVTLYVLVYRKSHE